MTAEQPLSIDTAAQALRAKVVQRGWSVQDLTASQAWAAVLDFASVPVDIPNQAEADGLLYQFGINDFSGELAFHFDPVRQLALRDEDEYVQVGIEMHFAPTPALTALGTHSEWWFSTDDTTLNDWAQAISRRPEWGLLDSLAPLSVEIRQDET